MYGCKLDEHVSRRHGTVALDFLTVVGDVTFSLARNAVIITEEVAGSRFFHEMQAEVESRIVAYALTGEAA